MTHLPGAQDVPQLAGSHEEATAQGDTAEVELAEGKNSADLVVDDRLFDDEGSDRDESDRHGIAAQREALRQWAREHGVDEVHRMLALPLPVLWRQSLYPAFCPHVQSPRPPMQNPESRLAPLCCVS